LKKKKKGGTITALLIASPMKGEKEDLLRIELLGGKRREKDGRCSNTSPIRGKNAGIFH